jgi:3-dehydroquinate synthase
MRGVPVIHVPTTLLAMVDASIGGKTGVDTPAGKNLVGAFHQPKLVVIDPAALDTLPMEHLRSGFAEIIKHGVVRDLQYFMAAKEYAVKWPAVTGAPLPKMDELITWSVSIKMGIVHADVFESGRRKVLNFGHTIGHAIEAATDYSILHGHAVAIGMVAEARIAERLGIAPIGTAEAIENVCRMVGLPTAVPSVPVDSLIAFTRRDKKARGGKVEYALPTRIGAMAGESTGWAVPVEDTLVKELLSNRA